MKFVFSNYWVCGNLLIKNFDSRKKEFMLHLSLNYEVISSDPESSEKDFGGEEIEYIWDLEGSSGETKEILIISAMCG